MTAIDDHIHAFVRLRRVLFAVSTFVLTAFAPVLHAENTEWRNGHNSLVLPEFCQDRLDEQGRWQKWRDHFGTVFIHMHHYCGGIYAEFKARTVPDKRKRKQWLHEAIIQMEYVSHHCDPTCVLYLDLHRRWAWALTQQGKTAEAMKHYEMMNVAR